MCIVVASPHDSFPELEILSDSRHLEPLIYSAEHDADQTLGFVSDVHSAISSVQRDGSNCVRFSLAILLSLTPSSVDMEHHEQFEPDSTKHCVWFQFDILQISVPNHDRTVCVDLNSTTSQLATFPSTTLGHSLSAVDMFHLGLLHIFSIFEVRAHAVKMRQHLL